MWRLLVRRGFATAADSSGAGGGTAAVDWSTSIAKTRNIGVIAHIDAGKTTTTERMLHYAGMTRAIGNVDDGNTVTDFMPQEQERGITIKAAAITFGWAGHRINLIDTPGHVDFTVEVERALRVLDGAVTVIDGVSGVQAQTRTVWKQAERRRVPRLIFINKLDRDGADVARSVQSIHDKLKAKTLLLQTPLLKSGETGSNYTGDMLDLVNMKRLHWSDREGRELTAEPLDLASELGKRAVEDRTQLVETLAELDDEFMMSFLDIGDPVKMSPASIKQALRRTTIALKGVPVLCGASYRNRGVQPLLDAVVDYLPSPMEITPPTARLDNGTVVSFPAVRAGQTEPSSSDKLCALAFKVTHDKQRGPLVFMRVYSGILENRDSVANTTKGTKERINKLLAVYAGNVEEVSEVSAGNIAVAVGFKTTATGDTLLAANDKRRLLLDGLVIPPPVFSRSVEAQSTSADKSLQQALQAMLLEDPSLQMLTDPDTGQTLLSGQGELHLEIVADRLKTEFNVEPVMGPVVISYREALLQSTANSQKTTIGRTFTYDREINGKKLFASMKVSLTTTDVSLFEKVAMKAADEEDEEEEQKVRKPAAKQHTHNKQKGKKARKDDDEDEEEEMAAPTSNNIGTSAVSVKLDEDSCTNALPYAEVVEAVRTGALNVLGRGPLLGYPIAGAVVRVDEISIQADTTVGALSACASLGTRELVRSFSSQLMEPMMHVVVTAASAYMGPVLSDMTGTRRGRILSITHLPDSVQVDAEAPLDAMVGYSSSLRSLTSGNASFSLTFSTYRALTPALQAAIMQKHGVMTAPGEKTADA